MRACRAPRRRARRRARRPRRLSPRPPIHRFFPLARRAGIGSRAMRRYLTALAGVAAALAFAACGDVTLSGSKANKFVEENLAKITPSDPGSVTADCPKETTAKKGKTFDCDITTANLGDGTVTVHIDSVDGTTVHLNMHPADVHLSGGKSGSSGGGSGGYSGYNGGGYGGYSGK